MAQVLDNSAPLVRWLQRASAKTRRTASVCSGAFLLAAAGLLEHKRATTHSLMCDMMGQRFPTVQSVLADQARMSPRNFARVYKQKNWPYAGQGRLRCSGSRQRGACSKTRPVTSTRSRGCVASATRSACA